MKKYLTPLLVAGAIVGGGALAAAPVLAHGDAANGAAPMMHMLHFGIGPMQVDTHADLLGISGDDLLTRLAQGQAMDQILSDLGLTKEDLKTRMDAQHESQINDLKMRLQSLVESGAITQEQADQFIDHLANPPAHPFMKRGMHKDWRGMHPPSNPPASS